MLQQGHFKVITQGVTVRVITVERYFKVVHAIAHRKYYRNWMTKAGAAMPWICGVCFVLIPTIGTTRVVSGTCQRMAVWPNQAMASVSAFFLRFTLQVVW